jgi:hypothetical protein
VSQSTSISQLQNHFFVDNYIAPNKIRTLFAPIFWGHILAADFFLRPPFKLVRRNFSKWEFRGLLQRVHIEVEMK